ncbi:MAG TPA: helix-turn-helix domain-containing protein [Blastocatellia bacterium]|nr:helix-turn-helix domain-containing protein [Blastocatellia bacterium]
MSVMTVTKIEQASDAERAYGVESAAALLDISAWTIRKWVSEGRIRSVKLGTRRVIPATEIRRLVTEGLPQA